MNTNPRSIDLLDLGIVRLIGVRIRVLLARAVLTDVSSSILVLICSLRVLEFC